MFLLYLLTIIEIIDILLTKTIGVDEMKAWSIRMPEELLEWVREKAAMESIKRKRNVSINSIMVEILTKAMEAERKEE